MEVKAEFIHIVPISITTEYPLKQLLDNANALPNEDLTFADVVAVLSQSFKSFTESHHLLFFTKCKLLFEKEVRDLSYLNIKKQTIKRSWLKILLIFHLAKNRRDFTKVSMTTFNNHVNMDDSIISQTLKPQTTLKLNIPNFLQNQQVFQELTAPRFLADFGRVLSNVQPPDIIATAEKKNHLDIDYSEYIEVVGHVNKVIVLENVKRKKLFISECSNSNIHFTSHFEVVIISRCRNCEVFVPGVKRVALVEHSSNLVVTIIAKSLHLSNVTDSTVNCYTGFEPELLGEIINLKIGPFNANFSNLFTFLDAIGLPFCREFLDLYARPKQFYRCQEFLNQEVNSFAVIEPWAYETFVLPKEFGNLQINPLLNNDLFLKVFPAFASLKDVRAYPNEIIPILVPFQFIEEMFRRYRMFKELMERVGGNDIKPEQRTLFLEALQGHFREWLLSQQDSTASLFRMFSSLKQ